jgi:hypothetical protein
LRALPGRRAPGPEPARVVGGVPGELEPRPRVVAADGAPAAAADKGRERTVAPVERLAELRFTEAFP